jgi:hypothetical protein
MSLSFPRAMLRETSWCELPRPRQHAVRLARTCARCHKTQDSGRPLSCVLELPTAVRLWQKMLECREQAARVCSPKPARGARKSERKTKCSSAR